MRRCSPLLDVINRHAQGSRVRGGIKVAERGNIMDVRGEEHVFHSPDNVTVALLGPAAFPANGRQVHGRRLAIAISQRVEQEGAVQQVVVKGPGTGIGTLARVQSTPCLLCFCVKFMVLGGKRAPARPQSLELRHRNGWAGAGRWYHITTAREMTAQIWAVQSCMYLACKAARARINTMQQRSESAHQPCGAGGSFRKACRQAGQF
jgi:hypothetical protein